MNTITRFGMVGAFGAMLAFGGCSTTRSMFGSGNEQTWTMQTQKATSPIEAKVQVASGEKGNRDLKVEAKHLAPAESNFNGTSTYVVWLKPENGRAVNIGVLSPDKDQNASLETSTSFTSFEVMVTAEDSPQPTSPSGNHVMSARVQVAT